MSQTEGYRGKRVVVSGAASGMGEAATRLLLEQGAEVHALDVAEVKADVASKTRCDQSDPAQVDAALAAIGGPIDALFACAGVAQTHPPVRVVTVNFLGTRQVIESALPRMESGAAIVCISSVAGMAWMQVLGTLKGILATGSIDEGRKWCEEHLEEIGDGYSFSKQALSLYVLQNTPAFAAKGIRINALCPGMTETPMMPDFEKTVGDQLRALPCPLERRSTPEEQAHALLFLNSPQASYLTGCEFFNDGGSTAVLRLGAAEAMLGAQ